MSLIRNSKQVRQTIDFTGVQSGKIHPTDIDVVLEFDNEVLILMEVKRIGNKIPIGQRLVLERIANSWHTKKSVVFYVTHDFKNDNKDIPLDKCSVESIYLKKEWKPAKQNINLIDCLKGFSEKWNIKKLKL
ncbi:hypothetical protein [uncultured Wocania sp.]|uniref:hypothetical protein n=1 Tax=uncultured Wocania sp. TaxID=2834404 RepID=UPI0030F95694